ncbi:MAG: SDR family oxidoreductase [Sphingomonadaceae bacterium]|nr:SDR family oxidoreductase [Sphingomonadaceae bacterium]
MKLKDKVALVSGSGRGIGKAIALKLASEGARVVVNDLDGDPANETVAEIIAAGGQAQACIGSVTDADFGERFVATAIDTFDGLDIIVNNAGYTWDSILQKTTDEQFQTMLDVHLVAPFRILRAAAEPIRAFAKREAQDGNPVTRKIVNISSVAGLGGNPGQASYSSAKAGILGLTKTMCKEWGRYRVNVNAVAFGLINTRLTQQLGGEAASISVGDQEINVGIQKDMLTAMEKQMIPLGYAGSPEDAANGVYLFCTPESDYISGEVVVVGGGITF